MTKAIQADQARAASLALLRDAGMTLLLVVLVATIFLFPVVAPAFGDRSRAAFDVVYVLALLAGAFAIGEHRGAATLAAALALAAMAAAWLPLPLPEGMRRVGHQLASLATIALIAGVIGMRVFGAGRITTDRVLGAVALYLLLGLVWGNAYEIAALVDPKAFSAPADDTRGPERWFYFSFVTLTTVGYGDVTPLSSAARVLAIGEALVGQLYPAVVLARLVTLQATPAEK